MKKKIPLIWKYYFLFGISVLSLHFIRYLNFYLTNGVPIYNGTIDYDFYSNISLLIRIISFSTSIVLIKLRSEYPVLATSIIWFMVWFLLSHEYELYLFIPVTIMTFFCFISLIFYKYKN